MTPVGSFEQSVGHSRTEQFRKLAKDIEAQFLAQMLKSAGVGKPRETLAAVQVKISFPVSWFGNMQSPPLMLAELVCQKRFLTP